MFIPTDEIQKEEAERQKKKLREQIKKAQEELEKEKSIGSQNDAKITELSNSQKVTFSE